MDIKNINILLEYIESKFIIIDSLNVSAGQRKVYKAKSNTDSESNYILKISQNNSPSTIPRLQREMKILQEIESEYFPQFYEGGFFSQEIINDFYDSDYFIQKSDEIKRDLIKEAIIPFFYSVENNIEHLNWNDASDKLKNEAALIDFLIDIFTALNLVWDNKIAHRDLKPGNILIKSTLKPVIIDFGAAKSFRDGTCEITQPYGFSPRTIPFASPEQLLNNKREIGYKSDQFSIGVMVFLILTGVYPYGDYAKINIHGLIDNFLKGNIESIRKYNKEISDNMINFTNKLLEIQTHRRYRRCETILNDLKSIKEVIK